MRLVQWFMNGAGKAAVRPRFAAGGAGAAVANELVAGGSSLFFKLASMNERPAHTVVVPSACSISSLRRCGAGCG